MSLSNHKRFDEMTPGERVKAKRVHLGWTLDQLAEASGVNKSNISQIERGGPFGPQRAMKLARALSMKLESIWQLPPAPKPAKRKAKAAKA